MRAAPPYCSRSSMRRWFGRACCSADGARGVRIPTGLAASDARMSAHRRPARGERPVARMGRSMSQCLPCSPLLARVLAYPARKPSVYAASRGSCPQTPKIRGLRGRLYAVLQMVARADRRCVDVRVLTTCLGRVPCSPRGPVNVAMPALQPASGKGSGVPCPQAQCLCGFQRCLPANAQNTRASGQAVRRFVDCGARR